MSATENKLHAEIMNIQPQKTLSHFLSTDEMRGYLLGHKEARHAAAEMVTRRAIIAQEGGKP